jgi:hypothetical protein
MQLRPEFDKYEQSVRAGGNGASSFSIAKAQQKIVLQPLSSLLIRSGLGKDEEEEKGQEVGGSIEEGTISSSGGSNSSGRDVGAEAVQVVPVADKLTTVPSQGEAESHDRLNAGDFHSHPVVDMSPLTFHQQGEEESSACEGDGHFDELWPSVVLPAIPGGSNAEEPQCSRD